VAALLSKSVILNHGLFLHFLRMLFAEFTAVTMPALAGELTKVPSRRNFPNTPLFVLALSTRIAGPLAVPTDSVVIWLWRPK
jgi:hypothetical protein